MDNPKILFIHDSLSSYNDPIYEMMNEVYDITHAYVEKNEVKNAKYKFFEFPHNQVGPFVIHWNLRKIINQYDIVIINAHLRSLRIVLLPFLPHKPKLISWSIGLHVSYNKKFDTNLPLNKINISKFDKNILTILFLGGIFQNVYNSYLFFVINGGSNETKRTCILA